VWELTPDEPTPLITSGRFGVVRNPILTSMRITFAGMVLMAPTTVSILGLAAIVTANELLVRLVKELDLRRIHRQQYVQYAKAVDRFVPRIGRLK